jgi:hypothetical protein
MKKIRIQSKSPIEIEAVNLLETINDLRKEFGDNKKDKAPIELSKALSKVNLFQNRNAEKGMLSFRLAYEDEDETPCVRDFPNFGLDVQSDSKLEQVGDRLLLSVDITVKAGKPKWQLAEVSECAKIFESGKFTLALNVTLDETTEWGGHSAFVTTVQDELDFSDETSIPASHFTIELK